MDENSWADRVLHRGLFFAAACVIVFFQLLPLGTVVDGLSLAPDLLLALTLAVILRRPDYAPVWLIAMTFLGADLLLFRPPGLWAILVVIATEYLRDRQIAVRNLSLPLEIGLVALIVIGLLVAEWLACMVFFLDQPGLFHLLASVPATVICYPLVVLFAQSVLGVRRPQRAAPHPAGRFA